MPVRTLGSEGDGFRGGTHRLEKRTSANEDAETQRWVDCGESHLDWGGERNTPHKGVETFP